MSTITGFLVTFGHIYMCCGVNFEGMCPKFVGGIAQSFLNRFANFGLKNFRKFTAIYWLVKRYNKPAGDPCPSLDHKVSLYNKLKIMDNSIQKPPFLPETWDFQISLCGNPVSTSRTPDSPPSKKGRKKKTSYTVAVQSGTKIGHGPKWLFKFFWKSEYMHLIGRFKKSINSIAVSVLIRP